MYGRYILILKCAFFLMTLAPTALAEDLSNLSTIDVVGRAKMMVAPNVATISFAVETNNPEAQQAVKENAKRTEKMLDALRRIVQKDAKIKTSGFSVSPVYEKGDILRPKGYRARNTVILETKELDKLGTFIDEASRAGANRFGSLLFSNDQEEEFKRQAAIKALNQAMKNAEALAAAVGLSIKRVVKITYGPRETPPLHHYGAQVEARGARTPVEVGEITIEASVNVSLEVN